jgi:dihydroneopterin aldolase
MPKIKIKNLKIDTIIGIHDHEKEKKQPLIIDIEIEFDDKILNNLDNINNAIDYYDLASKINILVKNSNFNLLETLSQKIINKKEYDLLTESEKALLDAIQVDHYNIGNEHK